MNTESNLALVTTAYERFAKGDVPALLGSMTSDVVWELPEMPKVPFAGRRQGTAQVAGFFTSLVESSEILAFEPRKLFAQGDDVVALGVARYRTRATGREWGGDFAQVFTLRDGKIAQFKELGDTASTIAAYA